MVKSVFSLCLTNDEGDEGNRRLFFSLSWQFPVHFFVPIGRTRILDVIGKEKFLFSPLCHFRKHFNGQHQVGQHGIVHDEQLQRG